MVRETPDDRWQVVNADDEVQAEFGYLAQAEEHVIVRTLASFFTHAIQEAFDSDPGEEVWESMIQFLGPHDDTIDGCPVCEKLVVGLIPQAAKLMADSYGKSLESLVS